MATPLRNFRLDNETWQQLKDRAQKEGTDASTIIRTLITRYLSK